MSSRFVTLSKPLAAHRQLRQAIRLFFDEGDMLAVHTLAAAAFGVFSDLGKRASIASRLRVSDRIVPERINEWNKALSATQNFLKHADKDPDATIQYNEDATVFLVLEAVDLAVRVAGDDCIEYQSFRAWFVATNPDLIKEEAREEVRAKLSGPFDLTDRRTIGRMLAEI